MVLITAVSEWKKSQHQHLWSVLLFSPLPTLPPLFFSAYSSFSQLRALTARRGPQSSCTCKKKKQQQKKAKQKELAEDDRNPEDRLVGQTSKPPNTHTWGEINDKWFVIGRSVARSSWALPVCPCGITATQTCEAVHRSHRMLGDTYIKQLRFLVGAISHEGTCETGALCRFRCFHPFPSPLSVALSGMALRDYSTDIQTSTSHLSLSLVAHWTASLLSAEVIWPSSQKIWLFTPVSSNLCLQPLPPVPHRGWPEVTVRCAAVGQQRGWRGAGAKSAECIGMATHMTSQSQFELTALCRCQTPMLPHWCKRHSLR